MAANGNFDATTTSVGDAIINGSQPPLSGFGANSKQGLQVKAYLASKGFDLSAATNELTATQDFIKSANSSQQLRLKQSISSVTQGLGLLQTDAANWNAGGFAPLNAANMKAAASGAYGQDAQKIAADFTQQLSLITDELGQTFMGGNSPTDKALGLAASTLNGSWSADTFASAISQLQTDLGFRLNAINGVSVGGLGDSSNPYSPDTGTSVQQQATAAGYDYSAMIAAGYTDAQIQQAINGGQ